MVHLKTEIVTYLQTRHYLQLLTYYNAIHVTPLSQTTVQITL